MKRDTDLDHFLAQEVRVTTPPTKAELAAQRQEQRVALASERQKIATEVRELRRSSSSLKKEVEDLVAGLGERSDTHDKGPYLGESVDGRRNPPKFDRWSSASLRRHRV